MADSWGKASKEVTCSICSNLFIEPKILPCLHTFCEKCLQDSWKKSVLSSSDASALSASRGSEQAVVTTLDSDQHTDGTCYVKPYTKSEKEKKNANTYMSISKEINCSLCSGRFTMTSAMITALPTNTAALQLVELVTMYEQVSKESSPSCQLCESGSKAISSCLQCNIFLCAGCEFTHKRLKLTSTHQINCLQDIKSGKVDFNSILDHKQELCSVHPDKYLELFCRNENCFICLGCAVVKHRDHQYDFISQIIEEQRQQIKSIFPSIETSIEQLEQASAGVEAMQKSVQDKRKQNIQKIEQTFSKINAALLKRKLQLLDEINKTSQDRINTLSAQQEQLDTLCKQMKNFLNTVKKTATVGRNQTVLDMKNSIMNRHESLISEKDQTELTPSQSVPLDVEFHTMDYIISLADQMGTVPCAEMCSVDKTAYRDYCEFTLTLKDHMNKPILGCAALVNAFSSDKSISDNVTIIEDPQSVPLKVYEVGNGEYTFFNTHDPHCNSCHKPINQQVQDVNRHRKRTVGYYAKSLTSTCAYCNHCGVNCTSTLKQYVFVVIDGSHMSTSPFNCQN